MNICTGPASGNLSPLREQKASTVVALGIGYGSTKKAPSSLSVVSVLALIQKDEGLIPFGLPCSVGIVNISPEGGKNPLDETVKPLADDSALELPMYMGKLFARAVNVKAITRLIESVDTWTAEPPEETLVEVKRKRIYVSSIQRTLAGVRIRR